MNINDKHTKHQKSQSMSTIEFKKPFAYANDLKLKEEIEADTLGSKNHNNTLNEINNNESVLIEPSTREDKIQNISHISDAVFDNNNNNDSNNNRVHDKIVNISNISLDTSERNNQHQHLDSQIDEDISNTNENRIVNTEYKLKPKRKRNKIYNPSNMETERNDLRNHAHENKKYLYIIFLVIVVVLILILLLLKFKLT
jgi:hypothetical protein